MPDLDRWPADPPTPTIRERGLLGGRLRLREAVAGYHAGLDAGLLAAAVGAQPGERVLEAGCGVGAALLQAATRAPGAHFTGLERAADALALARENVTLNALGDRVDVLQGDVAQNFGDLSLERFDAAFANPPFFDDPGALRGPAPERRGAWLAESGLASWIEFMVSSLREGGRATLIHRADRLADLLATLGPRAGSIRVLPIQTFADRPAKRVIVWAVRGGRAPLILLPALILHEVTSASVIAHTALADAVLRGDAGLGWEAGQSP